MFQGFKGQEQGHCPSSPLAYAPGSLGMTGPEGILDAGSLRDSGLKPGPTEARSPTVARSPTPARGWLIRARNIHTYRPAQSNASARVESSSKMDEHGAARTI